MQTKNILNSSFTIGGGLSFSGGAAAVSAGVTVTGAQILAGAGAVVGLGVLYSLGADRYKPKDGRTNTVQNEEFKRICDEYELNHTQRDRIHYKTTKKGYDINKIRKLIERLYPRR